jgi:hypothetical protein
MTPNGLGRVHYIFDGNPECNDAQGDGEVDEEGDQPVLGRAKLDEAINPPAVVGAQVASVTAMTDSKRLPYI